MLRAIDTAQPTTGRAHQLRQLGFEAVGVYLRPDRAPVEMIRGLRSVGIALWSVWEKGNPTDAGYFTASQAEVDAAEAASYARSIGQPPGTQIFVAVDYDAAFEEVRDYLTAFHDQVKARGCLASVYGSGTICSAATGAGLAHSGWLAQSRGWSGYDSFAPQAAIVQGPSTTIRALTVDTDTVLNPAVLW